MVFLFSSWNPLYSFFPLFLILTICVGLYIVYNQIKDFLSFFQELKEIYEDKFQYEYLFYENDEIITEVDEDFEILLVSKKDLKYFGSEDFLKKN